MSKSCLLTMVVLGAMLLPGLATAGDSTGACYLPPTAPDSTYPPFPEGGEGTFSYCADDFTEAQCDQFSGGGAQWLPGQECLDVDIPFGQWDGSCLLGFEPFDGVCLLLWVDPQEGFTAEELCIGKGQGTWFNDIGCGFPAPVLPKTALAGLVLLLLIGSLAALSLKG